MTELVAPYLTGRNDGATVNRQQEKRWTGTIATKPWQRNVTATFAHLETPEMVPTVIDLLRYQSERPHILIVDTGSSEQACKELEANRAEDVEIHYIRSHAYRHPSQPVSAACDLALSLCTSEFLYWCVDQGTEVLTQRGWLQQQDLTMSDTVLSMDPASKELRWSGLKSIFRKQYDGLMHRMTNQSLDALVTPGHKFAMADGRLLPVEEIRKQDRIQIMGTPEPSKSNVYSDAFVELVGWAVTEGNYMQTPTRKGGEPGSPSVSISQNPGPKADRIELALKRTGAQWSETVFGTRRFYVRQKVAREIHRVAPGRVLSWDFMLALSADQRRLLIETMVDGDGHRNAGPSGCKRYTQKDAAHVEAFTALCALAGIATTTRIRMHYGVQFPDRYDPRTREVHIVTLRERSQVTVGYYVDWHGGRGDLRGRRSCEGNYEGARGQKPNRPTEPYSGIVWCPETECGTFVCRRNGVVYVTGNTHADCFLRDRDYLKKTMAMCGPDSPVVGYEMSPRTEYDVAGFIGHTATMSHKPTLDRLGVTWSIERAYHQFGVPRGNMTGGWPDTEGLLNLILREAGVKPVLIGRDTNYERFTDERIDHVRSFASGKLYANDGSGSYHETAQSWLRDALTEAAERIAQWKAMA